MKSSKIKRTLSILLCAILVGTSPSNIILADEVSDNGVEVDETTSDNEVEIEEKSSVSENTSSNNEVEVTEIRDLGSENIVDPNTANESYYWPTPSCTSITPGREYSSNHTGLDIAAPKGTNVYATKSGTVKEFFNNDTCASKCSHNYGCGNGLYIYHDDGTWAEYAHMSKDSFPTGVYSGARVVQGQFLGQTGNSGNSDGPHLHFGIRTGNTSSYWSATLVNNNKDVIPYIYNYNQTNVERVPNGCLDVAEGGLGTIRVAGWAFDYDVPNSPIEVHVYVGGSAGDGGTHEWTFKADGYRPDIKNAYPGVGDYHGFDVTFPTNFTGSQPVYVYAINNSGEPHFQMEAKTVTIQTETVPPTISGVKTERIAEDTIKISCTATDESAVKWVTFPTWTPNNGQDDLASDWWTNCKGQQNDNTWSFLVKDSEHKFEKGEYRTDIYAEDKFGNRASIRHLYSFPNQFVPTEYSLGNHIYEVYDDVLTWDDARTKCQQLGGHLATITSQAEQDVITRAVAGRCRGGYSIGGSHNYTTWITGEQYGYTNWGTNEPSGGADEIAYEVFMHNGTWNDIDPNSASRGFICEYDPDDEKSDIAIEDLPTDGNTSGLWCAGINDAGYAYTGSTIKPKLKVYNGTKLLKKDVDYTISYKNNVNVYSGDDALKKPQAVISGMGNYSGKTMVTFSINPKNIENDDITIPDLFILYNGMEQNPIPTVKWNTKTLKYSETAEKSDYTYHCSGDAVCKEIGTYTVIVEGRGNYTGAKNYTLTIAAGKLLSKATFSISKKMPYADGNPVLPNTLTVKYGKTLLKKDVDYSVECSNNTQIGTAIAKIIGKGEYSGVKKLTYSIVGTKMSGVKISGITAKEFTGDAITQNPDLKYKGEKLTLNEDYTITYQNNTNAGTATMIITGIKKYYGTVKRTFAIKPYSIKNNSGAYFEQDATDISVMYAKGGATPDVNVKFKGHRLIKGKDYTLSYKNHTSVNDGKNSKKVPTITIKGKGNYKDSVKKTFVIIPGNLRRDGVSVTAADKVWKNKENAYKSSPTLYDMNGKKLVAGVDYSKGYVYKYANAEGAIIGSDDIPPVNSVIYVEVTGVKNYAGSTIGTTYRVISRSIKDATVSVNPQIYTGKRVTITKEDIRSIKIGKAVVSPDEYEIVDGTYKNNIKKGKASVVIRGIGQYGGKKTISFSIKSRSIIDLH